MSYGSTASRTYFIHSQPQPSHVFLWLSPLTMRASCFAQAVAQTYKLPGWPADETLQHTSHHHWKTDEFCFFSLPCRGILRFTGTYSACCSKRRKLCCISKRLEKQGLSDLNVSHKKMKSLFIALVSYESLDETTAEVKSTMWRSINFVLF